jgi:hypothetical protein
VKDLCLSIFALCIALAGVWITLGPVVTVAIVLGAVLVAAAIAFATVWWLT